jgi:RNA polymerase sigma-70 factor (ECF subfamily)
MSEIFSTGSGPDAWTDWDQPPWLAPAALREQRGSVVEPVELPLGFEAFYLAHMEPWQRFAEVALGDSGAAYQVCHEVFLYIAVWWHAFLDERSLESAVWEVLRAGIVYEKNRALASPSFFWKMTFGHAMLSSRSELACEEGPVMRAVSKLPPRQFDVVVLRHFMRRSREDIAWLLGCTPSTVDYHQRRARALLKELLTADQAGDRDDDEGVTA